MFVKFEELTKKQQKKVFAEIVQAFIEENGESKADAIECAKSYIIDNEFELVDYSPDEDGTDIRVEW